MIQKVTLQIGVWDDGVDKLTTRVARVTGLCCYVDAHGNRLHGGLVRVEPALPEEQAEFLALEEEWGFENATDMTNLNAYGEDV